MSQELEEKLGRPELRLGGLKLWIHGREAPEAREFFDANWLRVTAHCAAEGASVWVRGNILLTADIEDFGARCEALLRSEAEQAVLDPLEPELKVTIMPAEEDGDYNACVEITPLHLMQQHRMNFQIRTVELSQVVRQCAAILRKYPVKNQGR